MSLIGSLFELIRLVTGLWPNPGHAVSSGGAIGLAVDVLWTQTGFLGALKSKTPNPGNTKAAQCAALSLVGPVGLEPTTKGL